MSVLITLALTLIPTQSGHMRFALYGDDRDGHDIHRKIVSMIAKEHPDFVLNTGDLVKRGNRPDLWQIFDDITGELRKTTDYFAARGNHDFGDPDFAKRFKAPPGSGDGVYYSFDRGNAHFISLACDEHTDYAESSAQYKWLIQDLESHRGKTQHLFVFFHVPPFSIGSHGSDMDIRKTLCPIFEKYGVQAVLNGHDHNYYRTFRNGITYIVSGGGGAPLYDCGPSKGAIPGDKWEKSNHYVSFDVDGTKVHARAVRVDGGTIESFDLRAARSVAKG